MKNSLSLVIVVGAVLVGFILFVYAKGGYKNGMNVLSLQGQQNYQTATSLPPVKRIALTISSPANGSTVSVPSVTVRGKTVPKADVSVNDKDVVADASGNFSIAVNLDEGENTIVIVASDADGNNAEQELTVTYNSGQ